MSLLRQKLQAYERWILDETIRACGGNRYKAAHALGLSASQFYYKTRRRRWRADPAPRWDDEPLAWVIRLHGDRVQVGACWTVDEIAADAAGATTVAILRDVGPRGHGSGRARAECTARDINTKLAIRAAAMAAV